MHSNYEMLKEGIILEIPASTRYWLVRADGGKYYDDFFLNHYIGISNNEVTLKKIHDDDQLNSGIGRTIEGYKALFERVYPDMNNQQISHAASRTRIFMEEMQIGDVVVVPSKNSNKFILGVIDSEVYEVEDSSEPYQVDGKLTRSPYIKRRHVAWIKTVNREYITAEMKWILSAHQTIFNLDLHADHIDNLLTPLYLKGGKCYSTIRVGTEKGVSVEQWHELYSIIKEQSGDKSSEIIVKSNVQSPGWIEIIAAALELKAVVNATGAVIGSALLFGQINLFGVQVRGIVPYFFLEGKLERRKMELEIERTQMENDLKRIEIEGQKAIVVNEKRTALPAIASELAITPYDAGKAVPLETLKDIDVPQDEDGPEK